MDISDYFDKRVGFLLLDLFLLSFSKTVLTFFVAVATPSAKLQSVTRAWTNRI